MHATDDVNVLFFDLIAFSHTTLVSFVFYAEVSDQNFVDNHPGELSGGMPIAKKINEGCFEFFGQWPGKTWDCLWFLFEKLITALYKSTDTKFSAHLLGCTLQKIIIRKIKANSLLSSEHPWNFVPPNSVLCYCVRWSWQQFIPTCEFFFGCWRSLTKCNTVLFSIQKRFIKKIREVTAIILPEDLRQERETIFVYGTNSTFS